MTSLSTSIDAVFDDFKRRLDVLIQDPRHDNEATRHDRLVVPFLIHPLLLAWDLNDLVGQATISVPNQLLDSHIFRGAQPKSRKPDILVTSSAFDFNAFVVEEKDGQPSIEDLNGYRFQLLEYQSLYECVWGLLTDGEHWILKKGFETFHTMNSLDELRACLPDLQNYIGKQSLVARKLAHGTCDLVIVVPSGSLVDAPAKVEHHDTLMRFLTEGDSLQYIHGMAAHMARRYDLSVFDAEDIAQEAILSLLQATPEVRNLSAYTAKVVNFVAMEHARRRRRKFLSLPDLKSLSLPDDDSGHLELPSKTVLLREKTQTGPNHVDDRMLRTRQGKPSAKPSKPRIYRRKTP